MTILLSRMPVALLVTLVFPVPVTARLPGRPGKVERPRHSAAASPPDATIDPMSPNLDAAAGLLLAIAADPDTPTAAAEAHAIAQAIAGPRPQRSLPPLIARTESPSALAVTGLLGPSAPAAFQTLNRRSCAAIAAVATVVHRRSTAAPTGVDAVDRGLAGASAIPWASTRHLPDGLTRRALVTAAVLAARKGRPDPVGWPTARRLVPRALRSEAPFAVPLCTDVVLGNLPGIADAVTEGCDAVVSLCRIGTDDVPSTVETAEFWLIDSAIPTDNPNLPLTIADAADTVALLVSEGNRVYLHCHGGRSRTAVVAAAHLIRHHDVSVEDAKTVVDDVLPEATFDRLGHVLESLPATP